MPRWSATLAPMITASRRSMRSPREPRIDAGSTDGAPFAAMPVKVAGGVLPMTMLVNGVSVGGIDGRRRRLIDPPGPGFARLTVIDAKGAADTVVVRIQ